MLRATGRLLILLHLKKDDKEIDRMKKLLIAVLVIFAGFTSGAFCAGGENDIVSVMYHDVTRNPFLYSQYRISVDALEEDIKGFLDAGYTFLKATQVNDEYIGAHENNKFVVMTFDDGYESFYTEVYPLLKKYNVPASFYILTSQINRNNHLTTNQIAELGKSELVELGAHTHYVHRLGRDGIMAVYKDDAIWDAAEDYKTSIEIIEKITGNEVTSVTYPNGIYNDDIEWILKNNLGIKVTISTSFGKVDSFDKPFNRINRDLNFTSSGFLELINGLFDKL